MAGKKKNKTQSVAFRTDEELHRWLEQTAEREGLTMSAVVRQILTRLKRRAGKAA